MGIDPKLLANPFLAQGAQEGDLLKQANFGLGGTSTPAMSYPGISDGTQRATQDAYKRAMEATPESETAKLLANTDNESGTIPTPDVIHSQHSHLGIMGDDASAQAIADRIRRSYEVDLNRLKRQTQLGSVSQVSNKLNLAADAFRQKQQYDYNVYQRQMQQYQNEQKARNGVISSVLGAAGTVVGAIYGGPAGAVAGGTIGSGVGGQIGSGG